MKAEDIRHVFVVGAGTMGQQIALQCAMHGCDVTLHDLSPDALQTARARIERYAAQLVGRQRLTEAASQQALSRIRYTTQPKAAADADLLSESVPEDPDLKGRVFAQFNAICPPCTTFTTDTSTLLPSMFAAATGRPAQFAAFHFHTYVWDANLVDVMPHPGTRPEVVQLLGDFARRIGQVPLVLKKESPGYVVNAILGAINETAFRLVQDGVASVEDVDRAVMIVMKMATGPFASLDIVGLDTVWHVMQSKARLSVDPEHQAAADQFKAKYIDKGRLGVKSGGASTPTRIRRMPVPDSSPARRRHRRHRRLRRCGDGRLKQRRGVNDHELQYPAGAADRVGFHSDAIGDRSAVLGDLDVQA